MNGLRMPLAVSAAVLAAAGLLATPAPAGAHDSRGAAVSSHNDPQWHRSRGSLPISADWILAVKMDDRHIMWVGGRYENPADARRAFVYDVYTEKFREVAPVPFAKATTDVAGSTPMMALATIGALGDGSVVITGGTFSTDPKRQAESRLSYRYLPWRNAWVRTGDLPEAQQFLTPAVDLPHGRLLAAAGEGPEFLTAGEGSVRAFVYKPEQPARVDEIDPSTGEATGRRVTVRGVWSYTRTADGAISEVSQPHVFGNLVALHDGRALIVGGHTRWDIVTGGPDISDLATHTDFFDPETGRWTQGPPMPTVPGEDDRLAGSHGGRTNGVCVAPLRDNRVVIAGGATQTDGEPYGDTALNRQSVLVLTPATDPKNSRFRLSPHPIPSGQQFGGLFGGPGRNQLPCYVLSGDRVLIAGGQSDANGEDLYDTYLLDTSTLRIHRGPDLLHDTALWAQDPANGYPPDYQAGVISTREVNMRNSLLVFDGRIVVHGGGYNGVDLDQPGVPYVEQLDLGERNR